MAKRSSTIAMKRRSPSSLAGLLVLSLVFLDPSLANAETIRRAETTTTSGPVSGTESAQGVWVFKGIPYGDDTAKTRFLPPRPPKPWTEVRQCDEFGPMAPQALSGRGVTAPPRGKISEDCLHLNVWTPSTQDQKRRPVLVYFHGGAYNGGSVNDDLYDGTNLCRKGDVVVVTVNHRLNGFGFLYLGEIGGPKYAESGNVGMLDLVLALRWVRDNIANFGGDPGCVTIFGQSGGGAKCATLMAMPAAHGLFQRVWTMSGQQLTGRTREHATADARRVLANLGVTPEHLEELDQVPMAKLMAAMKGGTWTPVVDGTVLLRDPFSPDAPPLSKDIPMVLGNTHDETRNLIGGSDPDLFSLTWGELNGAIGAAVHQFIGSLDAAAIVNAYRQWYPQYSPSDVFFAVTTAARSWKGMVLESERRARQGAPTWVYYVNWPTPYEGGKWRAPHAIDIPMVFDNVTHSRYLTAGGADGQRLASVASAALLAFARTGNPNTPLLPPWPQFGLEHRPAMIFDLPPHVEDDSRGPERKLFAPVPYVQPGT